MTHEKIRINWTEHNNQRKQKSFEVIEAEFQYVLRKLASLSNILPHEILNNKRRNRTGFIHQTVLVYICFTHYKHLFKDLARLLSQSYWNVRDRYLNYRRVQVGRLRSNSCWDEIFELTLRLETRLEVKGHDPSDELPTTALYLPSEISAVRYKSPNGFIDSRGQIILRP